MSGAIEWDGEGWVQGGSSGGGEVIDVEREKWRVALWKYSFWNAFETSNGEMEISKLEI